MSSVYRARVQFLIVFCYERLFWDWNHISLQKMWCSTTSVADGVAKWLYHVVLTANLQEIHERDYYDDTVQTMRAILVL